MRSSWNVVLALSERAASTSQTKGPEEKVGQVTVTQRERPPLGGRPEAQPRSRAAAQAKRGVRCAPILGPAAARPESPIRGRTVPGHGSLGGPLRPRAVPLAARRVVLRVLCKLASLIRDV